MLINHDHVINEDRFSEVYTPQEDTFLLTEALSEDMSFLKGMDGAIVCLEVGCGSGCVITHLHDLLESTDCGATARTLCFATDVNKRALECTQVTANANRARGAVAVVQCDLVASLEDRLEGAVDILVFNPPYVPTPDDEYQAAIASVNAGNPDLATAWAGGRDGREVLDRLLPIVPKLLSVRGAFYVVLVKENKPEEIVEEMAAMGLDYKMIKRARAQNELLFIVRFSRPATDAD